MSLGFYLKVIYCLCARSCANRVDFYTIPYIRAHSLGVGLSNVRKFGLSNIRRILSRTRSLHTWSYACLTSESIPERILWRSARCRKESISCTRLLCTGLADSSCSWMKQWICESAGSDGESGNLHPVTRLASDLSRTRQKYHRMVHKYLCMVHI